MQDIKTLNRKWLQIAAILFIIAIVFLILGFYNTVFTFLGISTIIIFFIIASKYIRCPNCGRSRGVRIYLFNLLFSDKEINCPYCGEKLECNDLNIKKGL
ncbi:hypothetical protein [Anaerovorax odorimutans]|uniref:hypothetical protein n=1 Tax=Anaerovorax odorimutans TaxID=109327 RepID=UPI0003F4CEA0|nr:hypothetical protein [Anaerovorax odorimutans]